MNIAIGKNKLFGGFGPFLFMKKFDDLILDMCLTGGCVVLFYLLLVLFEGFFQ